MLRNHVFAVLLVLAFSATAWAAVLDAGDVPGLAAWLKADAITGVSDGGGISQWLGSGGGLVSADQDNADQQPTYHENVINGLPVVRFSNSGASYTNPKEMEVPGTWLDLGIGDNGQGMTLLAVLKGTATESPWDGENWPNGQGYVISDDNGTINLSVGQGGLGAWRHAVNTGAVGPGAADFSIVGATYSNVDPGADITISTYLDGAQHTQVSGTNSGQKTAFNILLGGDLPDMTSRPNFGGDLAELVIYNRLLSEGEHNQVGSYLEQKYGLDTAYVFQPEIHADFDMDGDVDFNDFSILAGNFTGTLDPGIGGFGPDEGDTDGDEDVDFTDFSVLAAEFTGTITAPAGDTPDAEGDVHMVIARDGTITLHPNIANLAGYSIRSSDSKLVPDPDGLATPFLFYLLNARQEVTAGSVGATTMLTKDLVLDIRFEGNADQAANLVFQYTRAGEVTPVDGIIHLIPEPATMLLLAAGGLLVLPRRRRAA